MNEDWRNELITKGAAFKKVEDKMKSLLKYFGYDSYEQADEKTQLAYDGMMDALTAIYDIPPSAQPQQIKGRWIHDGYDIPHGIDWMHCSICGRREPYVPAAMTNFCPTCGHEMRGVEDARI